MIVDQIKFKGHPCFKEHWSGFDEFRPISLIIGKNNSGKSHLLQFVQLLCDQKVAQIQYSVKVTCRLDAKSLQENFRPNNYDHRGFLGGDLWEDHGRFFADQLIEWESSLGSNGFSFPEDFNPESGRYGNQIEARKKALISIISKASTPIIGKNFRHLLADRDVQQEKTSNHLSLSGNGSYARWTASFSSPCWPESSTGGAN